MGACCWLRELRPGLCENRGVGGRPKRERTDVYLWLIYADVWQKPTHYCRAMILHLKINLKKEGTATSWVGGAENCIVRTPTTWSGTHKRGCNHCHWSPKGGWWRCPSLPQKRRKISNKQFNVTSRETREWKTRALIFSRRKETKIRGEIKEI